MHDFNDFYRDKTILVTGHTGFKGSWLSIWLNELGANVIGYALDPYSENDNFTLCNMRDKIKDVRGDIRDYDHLNEVFEKYHPEIVFHLAAQSLVRISYDIPVETYQTNVIGTINILECIRHCKNTKIGIMITTDKCYENKEQVRGYRENDPMGGYDPYSSSKGCAELAIASWRNSFMNPDKFKDHGKAIASVRAGNVIGGGDWAKHRLIPDCIRAIEQNQTINIHNPKAIRPWQFVLEPLNGYLLLGQKMYEDPQKFSEAWNFGPNDNSIVEVKEISENLVKYYGKGNIDVNSDQNLPHETHLLLLDSTKSKLKLNWKPKYTIEDMMKFTVNWYKNYKNVNMYDFCVSQIMEFSKKKI